MRIVLISVAVLVLGAGCFYGAVILASESGEVVTLRTSGAEGWPTRLWVVDYDGAEWVRTGRADGGWFRRIVAEPDVVLERKGSSSERTAVAVVNPEVSIGVNEAFAAKYGAVDWIVALAGDASRRVVVRLDRRR